jgi:hypothetical protein
MKMRETVFALPTPTDRIPVATAIRSTTIISSMATLRSSGLVDRYFALLPDEYAPVVRGLVAGEWLPMDLGMAHYGAVEGAQASFGAGARERTPRRAERAELALRDCGALAR